MNTEATACQLAEAIRDGSRSSAEIVDAHIARIEQVNPELNALIWPLFDQARAAAARADEIRASSSPDDLGLLHGVPITVKDQFFVRGTPVSLGLDRRSDTPVDEEGPLIARLREQGAIILGKTNLPQLLISHECRHARYGPARNPWDPGRAPGGSSGGEAAIIAARGSPLGLGGDMGGSIRIPAHCCGIDGIKPTGGRFPNDDTPLLAGYMGDLLGFETIVVQPGPLARSVDDLKLMLDALLGAPLRGRDLSPPVPWRTGPIADAAGLRVGLFEDNGFFTPSPAIRRLVREAGAALGGAGVEVVPFEPEDPSRGIALYLSLLCAGGDGWIVEALDGERASDDVRGVMRAASLPGALRGVLAGLMEKLGQRHSAKLLRASGRRDASEYLALTAERTRYRTRFLARMDAAGIDALLCPAFGLPAPRHDSNANGVNSLAASYSALFNLLDMPAGVVAAGRVREGEQSDRPVSRDKAERDAAQVERGSAGLPIGVQVAGRHWREDQVLALLKALEGHFRAATGSPSI